MNQTFGAQTHCFITVGMMALLFSAMGCGAVGPPIPPEDVGLEAKIRKQRQEQSGKEAITTDEDQLISPVDQPVELPTFYPIGTR